MATNPITGRATMGTTIISGHYAITVDPDNVTGSTAGEIDAGLTSDIKLMQFDYAARPVLTDKYGDTPIDYIYRGSRFFLVTAFREWIGAVQDMLCLLTASTGRTAGGFTDFGKAGVCGKSLWDGHAAKLILTAQSGTPAAATKGPATITCDKAILMPNNRIGMILGNDVREIRVIWELLPFNDGTNDRHFTVT